MEEITKQVSIGIDIGGSHVTAAAYDWENGKLLTQSRTKKEVDGHDTAENIIEKWAEAIQETLNKLGKQVLKGIGFAMPSPFDYERGIGRFELVDKFEHLNGVNVLHALKRKLPAINNLPLRFINDATAFALGEALMGKGKSYKHVMVLTLGTGLGSAFIKNGIPVVNGNNVPKNGCLWHLKYQEGIADDYFSTRWFIKEYEATTHSKASGVKQIAEAAVNSFKAQCLFEYFGQNLAEFLTPHIRNFNAEALILGGNITGAYPLFKEGFRSILDKNGIEIDIHISELKEDAAIYGSGLLLDDTLFLNIKPTLKYM